MCIKLAKINYFMRILAKTLLNGIYLQPKSEQNGLKVFEDIPFESISCG